MLAGCVHVCVCVSKGVTQRSLADEIFLYLDCSGSY